MKQSQILALGSCLLLVTYTVWVLQSSARKLEPPGAGPVVDVPSDGKPKPASLPVQNLIAANAQPPEKNVDAFGKYSAQPDPSGAPVDRAEAEAKLRGDLRVEAEGSGRYRIGSVTLDSARRTVTLPATVNMVTGAVEYALVTESGKVHEALFSTAASAMQIHLACLLLGIAPEKSNAASPSPKGVRVTVTWDTNGPPAEHDLSQLVVVSEDPNRTDGAAPLPIGPWDYTGSVTDAQGIAAAREGSIISLIPDQASLVNNPRESANSDDHHFPNHALLPPKGSSVRIVFTLLESARNR